MEPTTTGYLDTEGLRLYYETYGSGEPLLLLHGGVLNVELAFADLIPTLAERHRVIALDQQAHGRSSDSEREITLAGLARDARALLDHLGVDRAHVLGHSMGAAVALELAIRHGDRLLSVVPVSATVRPTGMHPDLASPEAMAASTRMPTRDDFVAMQNSYAQLSSTPGGFDALMAKMQGGQEFQRGWSDEELSRIAVPTLLVQGDHDFTTIEHAGLMLALIPGSALAVLAGTTHMRATHRVDLLGPVLSVFWAWDTD